jgi:hypothetical protein
MQLEGEGIKAIIDRDGDKLTYQGMALTSLRDTDLQQVGGNDLLIEGTLLDIDDKRKLVAVYTYYPIDVIGPSPGSRWQLFSIVDGKVKDQPEHQPQRMGKLTVMLYQQQPDRSPFKQPKGLYTVDTSLILQRVSDVPESRSPVYVDRQGDMFTIRSIGNTITNQTRNISQLWLDTKLMGQK